MSAEAIILGSTVLSFAGGASRSSARKEQAKGERDSRLAEAAEARARTALSLRQQEREAQRRRGALVTSFEGITLRGTPADILVDLATEEELARQIVVFEGQALEARALRAAGLAERRRARENPFLAGLTEGALTFARLEGPGTFFPEETTLGGGGSDVLGS